jgi:hypothetical protein
MRDSNQALEMKFTLLLYKRSIEQRIPHCTPELKKPIWWRLWLGIFQLRVVTPSITTKDMKSLRPKGLRRERVPRKAAVASTLDTAIKG